MFLLLIFTCQHLPFDIMRINIVQTKLNPKYSLKKTGRGSGGGGGGGKSDRRRRTDNVLKLTQGNV